MILERLKNLIGNIMLGYDIDMDRITMTSTLKGDLGFSSISMLLMAIAIEEEFNISISLLDGNTFVTVGDAHTYIEQALEEK